MAQIFSILGSYASLVGVILVLRPPDQHWSGSLWGLLAFGSILFLVAFYYEIVTFLSHRRISLKSKKQIRDYLFNWISRGDRVVIFSRDMTWANDEEMKDLLRRKARRDELHICVPNRIPLCHDLESEGAHIHDYPSLKYSPVSRFTIINSGRMDAQLTVGRGIGKRHVIQEFSYGQDPAFFIANDLAEIVRRLSQTSAATATG